jgi:hypothetical protein
MINLLSVSGMGSGFYGGGVDVAPQHDSNYRGERVEVKSFFVQCTKYF